MIAHILLLPHAEHRERLLAQFAPSAYRLPDKPEAGWVYGTVVAGSFHYADADGWVTDPAAGWSEHALVLARDHAVCPEGADRLGRVSDWLGHAVESMVLDALSGDVASLRALCAPLGTLVLIDADGREVSDG